MNSTYKDKLKQFNSTDKYKSELNLLHSLVDLQKNDKCLDYGCGLGTAMQFLKDKTGCDVYGFDITEELYEGDKFYFRKELYFKVDVIYFLHSIAHIPFPETLLMKCKDYFLKPAGRIVIITPNKDWLKLQKNSDYTPDNTVIEHFTKTSLKEMVQEAGMKVTLECTFGQQTEDQFERICIKATC